jgi:hypothetical protein
MNNALKASIRAIPERTVYAAAGSIAVAGAAIPILVVAGGANLGVVVGYALLPFAIALVLWTAAWAARLRMVGSLPNDAAGLIPARLEPWIRAWLLIRLGLLASALLLIAAAIATAMAHGRFGYVIEAFVYAVWLRLFLDLVFGATLNVGMICPGGTWRRRRDSNPR